MKKVILTGMTLSFLALSFTSCGEAKEKVDGASLAKEVCDCYTHANGLSADDPNRTEEQNKCSELQKANWDKVSGDTEQEKAFNDQFPCGM